MNKSFNKYGKSKFKNIIPIRYKSKNPTLNALREDAKDLFGVTNNPEHLDAEQLILKMNREMEFIFKKSEKKALNQ